MRKCSSIDCNNDADLVALEATRSGLVTVPYCSPCHSRNRTADNRIHVELQDLEA